MEHFESLRNGINNPPISTMSQQSNAASDTTADTNDMANLRQVIPGSQQQPLLSQLSERSEGDDINDAMMFSQNSNDDNDNSADRNARRLRWMEKEERSEAAESSNNPIEKMRAAVWSKVEDTPTNTTGNTNNNNNSTPSWADRISGVTKNVLVGNNTTTTTTKSGDLGDLAKSPSRIYIMSMIKCHPYLVVTVVQHQQIIRKKKMEKGFYHLPIGHQLIPPRNKVLPPPPLEIYHHDGHLVECTIIPHHHHHEEETKHG